MFIPDPYCSGHETGRPKGCNCHFWPSAPPGMEYFDPKEEYAGLRKWYIETFELPNNSVQRTACRLGENPIHVGPFLYTPEGKSKCDACGEEW